VEATVNQVVISSVRRLVISAVALAGLAGASGCGSDFNPVTGRVTFPDGTPLEEGIVICEMKQGDKTVMARGNLERDGSFKLGTLQPGDGAAPGKYQVLVVPRALTDAEKATIPPLIDSKFERFETSGLELEVKEGKNELNISVTKPGQ
jgi:hypothetical protein